VPRARDSGGSGPPRVTVAPMLPSTENKSLGIRNEIDFGAESSRPAFSLSTLLFSTVARRKARLATGLLATALAGLDFHQLDSVERFHPLTGIPLSQALLGAIFRLSADAEDFRYCGCVRQVIQEFPGFYVIERGSRSSGLLAEHT
jgi:hypothetical protein